MKWKNKKERIDGLNIIGKHIGVEKPEDWYRMTTKDVLNAGGRGLLAKYNGSLIYALMDCFPEYELCIYLFKNKPQGFWKDIKNRRGYIFWLTHKLGYYNFEDWYKLKQCDFVNNQGIGIIDFCGSYADLIVDCFPEYDWKRWLFTCVSENYWDSKENRLDYFEWLGNRLEFETEDDWYNLTQDKISNNYGEGLLQLIYNHSPVSFLKECMPEIEWKEWLFSSTPNAFWKDKNNVLKYLMWLKDRLNFKTNDDWYKLSCVDLTNNYGQTLLSVYGSPARVIMSTIDYEWDIKKFYDKLKSQKRLYDIVVSVFPDKQVEWNFTHKSLRFSKSKRPMQLDVFVPELNLAFEYQGEQHFFPINSWGGEDSFRLCLERDEEKRKACKDNNISLIEINYKWNKTKSYVKKAISNYMQRQGFEHGF